MSENARQLSDFFELVMRFSREEFQRAYPDPFLIQVKETLSLEEDDIRFTTAQMTPEEAKTGVTRSLKRRGSALVFEVVKRSANVFRDMISVGRPQNNDIVLPFGSISKFHAYFTFNKNSGLWSIADAKSTNGTFVNDVRLEPEKPHVLQDGDLISFSPTVSFIFRLPGSFFEHVRSLMTIVRLSNSEDRPRK